MNDTTAAPEYTGVEIAIVGMAGRFPGAENIERFWCNIRDGVESVAPLDDDALHAAGVSAEALSDPAYVRSGIRLEGMDRFDAGFFGYAPRDAEYLDPQQRVFLETAWEALEHAGYAGAIRPLTAVFAGSGAPVYLLQHLMPRAGLAAQADIASALGLMNGNDKDSLAARTAYKLDLRGPAVSVQTACSTSLAAVHLACRSLLNHEADMALAGGVWLNLMQDGGYRYQSGAILSPDGHCRAFDAAAAGTAIGSGAGVVVLRRLEDALADGDTIHAVIKGSALNNDGAARVGYTAPSVDGQAEVILAAQAMAGVTADSIGYVEAHGTGTALGDPIEVAALTQAFRAGTQRSGYCALGSVKTNIGHLDAAAGVTGLIKTVLALRHRTLPPSLNFERPNPRIDFASSPFFVNTEARPWPANGQPRRAGVSSFGMGGTNVHVVLEEAPAAPAESEEKNEDDPGPARLLMVSARSAAACERAALQLADYVARKDAAPLADIAHTLRSGRRRFAHRVAVLAHDRAQAARALAERDPARCFGGQVLSERPSLAFLFPGQGAQHVQMGRQLYEREPVFRREVDRCCTLLAPRLGMDLRTLLFPAPEGEDAAAARLAQTEITQPALFVIEYAMAQLWLAWGAKPDAMIGHSLGEYVAACLAGVFALEDALEIVALRGRLLQVTAPGAMLSVGLDEDALAGRLKAGCDLAAVNADDLCVLSGHVDAIEAVERELSGQGVAVRRLHVSHAFHSALTEPVLDEFAALLSRVTMRPPRIPFVSNLSGRFITDEQACSPAYWVRHVRETVRFADGLAELLARPDRLLLEVGPGETLATLARRHPLAADRPVLSTQCHPGRREQNAEQPLRCQARMWVAGIELEGPGEKTEVQTTTRAPARRVPLPTYPFERQSYWIPRAVTAPAAAEQARSSASRDLEDWFHVPGWRRAPFGDDAARRPEQALGTLLLLDGGGTLGGRIAAQWSAAGRTVVHAVQGAAFARLGAHRYVVRAGEADDFEELLRRAEAEAGPVSDVCHLWCLDDPAVRDEADWLTQGFHSLMALTRALGKGDADRKTVVTVVADRLEDVGGDDPLCPEKAALHGVCRVAPQEHPQLSYRVIDVRPEQGDAEEAQARRIVGEMRLAASEPVVAYRGARRWSQVYERVGTGRPGTAARLRRHGVYLITGGLGGIGLSLARYLAETWQARLVLVGRTALPERGAWTALASDAATPPQLAQTLRSLILLEAAGAEVLALQADVADPAQVRDALACARARFGAIHGLIHAAGVAGGGVIAGRTRAETGRVFAPKLAGTRNVLDALDSPGAEPPDFALLCSSLTAIAGGFGQADYCAANCFLDALAAQVSRAGRMPVLAVDWDAWREVGMAARQNLPEGVGIAPEQAGPLLERLLALSGEARVVVSTLDIDEQIARMQSPELAELAERIVSEPVRARTLHPRPALQTPFAEPGDELEQGLAALWSDFLGIAPVGAHDNLFELGGDSLLAIQLLARVRRDYGVDIHPALLFRTPTVATLAGLLEARLIEEIENAPAGANT